MVDRIRVLYVDDEPDLLEIGKMFLEESGDCSVATIDSANAALNLISKERFDAIISDYQMPGMDGIHLLIQVRQMFGDVPFILFTGKGREEVVIQAINSGVDFYIQKGGDPVAQFAELGHKIKQAVFRKKADDALKRSEEKYRTVFENTGTATVVLEESGIISLANNGFVHLSGFPKEEIEGKKSWIAFVVPEDLERMLDQHRLRRQNKGSALTNYEFRFVTKSGDIRTIYLSIDVIPGTSNSLASLLDITDWKQAKEALSNSEGRLYTLVQTIPDLIWLKDKKGVYLSCNTMFERFFGAREAEIVGKTDFDFVDPELAGSFLYYDRKAMEAGKPTRNEEWITFADDGHRAFLETIKTPMFDAQGTLIGVLGIGRDITERNRAEAALTESERTLRINEERLVLAQRIGQIGSWEYDLKTSNIWGSSEALHIFGYSQAAGDFPINDIEACIPERKRVHQALIDLIATEKEYNIEYTIKPADGLAPKEIHSVALLEKDATGNPIRVIGVIQDITKRKQVEEELRESRQILEAIINTIPFRVFWKDMDLTYLGCNTIFARDAGFEKPEDVIGKDDYSMGWREQAELYRADDRLVIESGRPKFLIEEPQTTPSGERICLLTSKVPLTNAAGETVGVLGTYLDISERKLAEEALHQANKKLKLLSGITRHDINNQLLALNGFLELLGKNSHDPALVDYIVRIRNASALISNMIQFTKTYESIGVHSPAWQDCRTLVDAAAKEVPLGKIVVNNDLPASAEVFADPLIFKVFYNLMDNVVRYGGKSTTIRFMLHESGEDYILICEDDGVGVPVDEKETIFERAFGKNTGLGLFLSREILSITGITITENGVPGMGARVDMTVPKGSWRFVEADRKRS